MTADLDKRKLLFGNNYVYYSLAGYFFQWTMPLSVHHIEGLYKVAMRVKFCSSFIWFLLKALREDILRFS